MTRPPFASTAPLALILILAACDDRPSPSGPTTSNVTDVAPANSAAPVVPTVPIPTPKPTVAADDANWPPAPGTPGGLPDDRRPVPEMHRDMSGPPGAGAALETYTVNVEGKHWTRAHQQWGSDAAAIAFEQRWRNASEVHALIGMPGDTEGGAGSIYSNVPIQFYGTRLDGTRFNSIGTAVMRRVNGVDGATPRQLSWHVDSITLKDTH